MLLYYKLDCPEHTSQNLSLNLYHYNLYYCYCPDTHFDNWKYWKQQLVVMVLVS